MKPYLNDLIRPGQNAFIKGRQVSDNIRLLFDVLDYTDKTNISGLVLTLDVLRLLTLITGILCF